MDKLLTFIAEKLSFLFEENIFRIKDSFTSKSFGGDSLLDLEGEEIILRITKDRGQFIFGVKSKFDKSKSEQWYSIDLLYYYLEKIDLKKMKKENLISGIFDDTNLDFLRNNIGNIILAFKKENIVNTVDELKKIQKIRTKIMFD